MPFRVAVNPLGPRARCLPVTARSPSPADASQLCRADPNRDRRVRSLPVQAKVATVETKDPLMKGFVNEIEILVGCAQPGSPQESVVVQM